jgi:hypothetical protein
MLQHCAGVGAVSLNAVGFDYLCVWRGTEAISYWPGGSMPRAFFL